MFLAKTVTGPAVYHFGVIDFLQNWTFQKKIERAFKIYVLRKDPDGLSVMAPEDYKVRFQQKLEQIFDVEGTTGGIGKVELPSGDPQVEEVSVEIDDAMESVGNPLQEYQQL